MTDSSSAYSQPAYSQPGAGQPGAAPKKTLSLIGMIGGIVGLLSIFGGWALLFSIAGVVLGHLGQRREGQPARGFWLTALITGYLGILIAIGWIILYIVGFAALASDPSLGTTY